MAGRQSAATERALARIRAGANPHAAAIAEGIKPSTIYRALKRERDRTTTMGKIKIVITKGMQVYVDGELFADYRSRNDGAQLAEETAYDLHNNGEKGDGTPTHYWKNMPQDPYS